jgi:hypothetical protein
MNVYCVQQGKNPETSLWEKKIPLYVQIMQLKVCKQPFFLKAGNQLVLHILVEQPSKSLC